MDQNFIRPFDSWDTKRKILMTLHPKIVTINFLSALISYKHLTNNKPKTFAFCFLCRFLIDAMLSRDGGKVSKLDDMQTETDDGKIDVTNKEKKKSCCN